MRVRELVAKLVESCPMEAEVVVRRYGDVFGLDYVEADNRSQSGYVELMPSDNPTLPRIAQRREDSQSEGHEHA